jgi:hypothetical protein
VMLGYVVSGPYMHFFGKNVFEEVSSVPDGEASAEPEQEPPVSANQK